MNAIQQMIAHGATHIDTEDLAGNPWMKRDINGWHYWDDEDDAWDHCFNVTDEDNMLPLPDDQPAPYWADEPENEPANNAPTWADAPAWADCYGKVGIGSKTIWYNNEQYSYADGAKNGVYWFDNPSNHNLAHVTPIERRPTNAPTWDGQGLPPVGIECEVCTNDGKIQWQKVTILAHDEHRAIFRDPLNKSIPTVYDWGSAACFRPLPTPDARRAEVVKQALATYKNANPDDRSRTRMLGELYDNGMLTLPEDT